jgi:hypothetical protein
MKRVPLAAIAAAALAVLVLATGATAGQVYREAVHFEEAYVDPDFCGTELDVEIESVIDGRLQVVPHGPDGLDYFLQHGTRTERLSANGTSVNSVANVIEKDKRVTDNGDGTLTVLILATGNAVLYGADGRAIARNPGQVRFEILLDHKGTLDDPFDDEFLDFLGIVKESTGRSDDFCEAAVDALV